MAQNPKSDIGELLSLQDKFMIRRPILAAYNLLAQKINSLFDVKLGPNHTLAFVIRGEAFRLPYRRLILAEI